VGMTTDCFGTNCRHKVTVFSKAGQIQLPWSPIRGKGSKTLSTRYFIDGVEVDEEGNPK
jgi:hypothetical protein